MPLQKRSLLLCLLSANEILFKYLSVLNLKSMKTVKKKKQLTREMKEAWLARRRRKSSWNGWSYKYEEYSGENDRSPMCLKKKTESKPEIWKYKYINESFIEIWRRNSRHRRKCGLAENIVSMPMTPACCYLGGLMHVRNALHTFSGRCERNALLTQSLKRRLYSHVSLCRGWPSEKSWWKYMTGWWGYSFDRNVARAGNLKIC